MYYTIKLDEKEYKLLQEKVINIDKELDKRKLVLDSLLSIAKTLGVDEEGASAKRALKDIKEFEDKHTVIKNVVSSFNNAVQHHTDQDVPDYRSQTLDKLAKEGITPIDGLTGQPWSRGMRKDAVDTNVPKRDYGLAPNVKLVSNCKLDKDKLSKIYGSLYVLKGIMLERTKAVSITDTNKHTSEVDKDIEYLYSIIREL